VIFREELEKKIRSTTKDHGCKQYASTRKLLMYYVHNKINYIFKQYSVTTSLPT